MNSASASPSGPGQEADAQGEAEEVAVSLRGIDPEGALAAALADAPWEGAVVAALVIVDGVSVVT